MKRVFFTLFILIIVGGLAFAAGDKEETSTMVDSIAVAAGITIEEAVDNSELLMSSPIMVVANTTRYDFINLLDDRKRFVA